MNKIILILGLLLISVSSIMSQAKVGTTGAQFLELPLSVKSIGMGQAGSAIVSINSYFINPASLSLFLAENNVSVSKNPASLKSSSNLDLLRVSVALQFLHRKSNNSEFILGGAYYNLQYQSGYFMERTYESGANGGTGRTFSWKDKAHNFVLSFAYRGVVDFAGGITVKSISQNSHEYSAGALVYDVGVILRNSHEGSMSNGKSSFLNSSYSLSVKNFGPDMKFISNTFSLPRVFLFGTALEIGQKKVLDDNQAASIYKLIPAIDIEKHKDDLWIYKFGIDVSYYEILNFRIGKMAERKFANAKTSYGFTISSFNIGKFKQLYSGERLTNWSEVEKFLFQKLNIEYSFAHKSNNYISINQNYHRIALSFKL